MYNKLWRLHHTCVSLVCHFKTHRCMYTWDLCVPSLCAQRTTSFVTMCSSLVLLLLLSTGELAGLHRRAGASRTSGPSASAQTPHEAAADTAGQGAADRPGQLHMRAPENSRSLGHHSARRNNAAEETHAWGSLSLSLSLSVAAKRDKDVNASYKAQTVVRHSLSDLISAAVPPCL